MAISNSNSRIKATWREAYAMCISKNENGKPVALGIVCLVKRRGRDTNASLEAQVRNALQSCGYRLTHMASVTPDEVVDKIGRYRGFLQTAIGGCQWGPVPPAHKITGSAAASAYKRPAPTALAA